MRRRVPMVSGHEYDSLTKGGRKVHVFKAGVRSYTKRKFRRRERRALNGESNGQHDAGGIHQG